MTGGRAALYGVAMTTQLVSGGTLGEPPPLPGRVREGAVLDDPGVVVVAERRAHPGGPEQPLLCHLPQ